MAHNTAGRKQEFVALNGGEPVTDELRQQIARLELELQAERASAAALQAQLTAVSRQLEAADAASRKGIFGRKRR